MQKKTFLLYIAVAVTIAACNSNDTSTFSTEQSNFLAHWVTLADKKQKAIQLAAVSNHNMPMKRELVKKCRAEFIRVFGPEPPTITKAQFTDFVGFDIVDFMNWDKVFNVLNRCDVLNVEFGIYTQDVIDAVNSDSTTHNDITKEKLGRVTVFISPYIIRSSPPAGQVKTMDDDDNDDAGIPSLNLGSLHP